MARTGRPIAKPEEDNIIAEVRRKTGMSQGELAGKLGISRPAVANYENGKRPIPGPVRILCEQFLKN